MDKEANRQINIDLYTAIVGAVHKYFDKNDVFELIKGDLYLDFSNTPIPSGDFVTTYSLSGLVPAIQNAIDQVLSDIQTQKAFIYKGETIMIAEDS